MPKTTWPRPVERKKSDDKMPPGIATESSKAAGGGPPPRSPVPTYPSRSVFDLSNTDASLSPPKRKLSKKKSSATSEQDVVKDADVRKIIRRHHSGNTVEHILGLASMIGIAKDGGGERRTTVGNTSPPDTKHEKIPFRHALPLRARSFESP
ncbi:MAG: hypothetical protein SGARI_003732, partial [Bacillariaceae sp.]